MLSAPYVLEYGYTRTLGPVMGRFFGGLKQRRVLGARVPSGQVIVPPTEFDPRTGAPMLELVELGQSGVVTTWAWNGQPLKGQPLKRPFAWALIRLDGADTPMLHAVDAGEVSRMRTGMRVRVRWREETRGEILDIACFEPEAE